MYKGEKPLEAGVAPGWTLDHLAVHAVDFWLSTEDLQRPDNRITVDGLGTITLNYTAANEVPKQKLYEKLKSMLNSLDMHDPLIPPSRSCMLTGRNHHSNAMSCITEGSAGYPASNGVIPFGHGLSP